VLTAAFRGNRLADQPLNGLAKIAAVDVLNERDNIAALRATNPATPNLFPEIEGEAVLAAALRARPHKLGTLPTQLQTAARCDGGEIGGAGVRDQIMGEHDRLHAASRARRHSAADSALINRRVPMLIVLGASPCPSSL
jgi:hypothetical protein